MVAGLAVQDACLLLFMGMCAEFAWRVKKNKAGLIIKDQTLVHSLRFKCFLWCKLSQYRLPAQPEATHSANVCYCLALGLATICIFFRSVFRVTELSGGFGGRISNKEVPYMILEGAVIIIASIALTILHPGVGFGRDAWAEGNWSL
jgi:hypothetical protein